MSRRRNVSDDSSDDDDGKCFALARDVQPSPGLLAVSHKRTKLIPITTEHALSIIYLIHFGFNNNESSYVLGTSTLCTVDEERDLGSG